jgi:hypothetical protein
MTKILNFPRKSERTRRKRISNKQLLCEYSTRSIKFSQTSDKSRGINYLDIQVMTEDADENERKLCGMTIDLDAMREIIKTIDTIDWDKKGN